VTQKITEEEAVNLMLAAGVKPLTNYPGHRIGWKSVCLKCNKVVSPRLGNIKSGQGACGYCSGVRIDVEDAIKLFQSVDLNPLVEFPGAQKPWESRCMKCLKIVSPSYTTIQQGKRGCVFCAGNRITIQSALDVMTEAGYKPLEPYPGSGKNWKCVCLRCGKMSTPRFGDVRIGNKCGYCSKVRVDEADAVELMKKSNLLPLEPFKTANTKWRCKCLSCGNIVFPRYGTIQSGNGGCRFCASFGINLDKPALLYLITNSNFAAHKIGITNLDDDGNNSRMVKHKRNGWETYKSAKFSKGEYALIVEQGILVWFREDLGLAQFLNSEQMPQGGWTETVDASEIDLSTIWAKIEELSKVKK
jgi:hypothetical protein